VIIQIRENNQQYFDEQEYIIGDTDKVIKLILSYYIAILQGVPELAPQRKLTNADDNLDLKNANEDKLMACITQL
jgi:hypothetical protein